MQNDAGFKSGIDSDINKDLSNKERELIDMSISAKHTSKVNISLANLMKL